MLRAPVRSSTTGSSRELGGHNRERNVCQVRTQNASKNKRLPGIKEREAAVKAEKYLDAKTLTSELKDATQAVEKAKEVATVQQKIAKLEKQKVAAAERGDFDAADQLKTEASAWRAAAADLADMTQWSRID